MDAACLTEDPAATVPPRDTGREQREATHQSLRGFLERVCEERLPWNRIPDARIDITSPSPAWQSFSMQASLPGNLNGTLDLWGWSGRLTGELSASGLHLRGQMDPIALEVDGRPVLTIEGCAGAHGPLIDIRTSAGHAGCFVSGRLRVLDGPPANMLAGLESNGFEVRLDREAPSIYGGARLSYQRGRFLMTVHHDLSSMARETGLEGLRVIGNIELGTTGFRQSLVFSAKLAGRRRTTRPINWNAPIADRADLVTVLAMARETSS